MGAIPPPIPNRQIRLKLYYYDNETGLCYLQSRYYNPETGRFLNTDIVFDYDVGVHGYNLFMYCGNNPNNRIDISGRDSVAIEDLDLTNDQLSEKEGGSSPGLGNRSIGIGKSSIAKTATNGSSNKVGKIGEQLAGIDFKAKTFIEINGHTRIPDALSTTALTEVKNVKYISNIAQLRDFAAYARNTGRTMVLYVRPTTVVAKTVIAAGWNLMYLW